MFLFDATPVPETWVWMLSHLRLTKVSPNCGTAISASTTIMRTLEQMRADLKRRFSIAFARFAARRHIAEHRWHG
jgi:hypothetical protein